MVGVLRSSRANDRSHAEHSTCILLPLQEAIVSPTAESFAKVELNRIDPTWRIALRVWWSWQWRTLLGSVGIGVLIYVWATFWFGGLDPEVRAALSYAVWITVGVYFFKDLLHRDFETFRVLLIARHTRKQEEAQGGEAPGKSEP